MAALKVHKSLGDSIRRAINSKKLTESENLKLELCSECKVLSVEAAKILHGFLLQTGDSLFNQAQGSKLIFPGFPTSSDSVHTLANPKFSLHSQPLLLRDHFVL